MHDSLHSSSPSPNRYNCWSYKHLGWNWSRFFLVVGCFFNCVIDCSVLVSWVLCCYCDILGFIFFKYRNSGINLLLLCEEEMFQGRCIVFYGAFSLSSSVSLSPFLFAFFFSFVTAPPKILQSWTGREGVKLTHFQTDKVTEVHWCPGEGNTNAAFCMTWIDASKFPNVASDLCWRIRKPGLCISIQERIITKSMC